MNLKTNQPPAKVDEAPSLRQLPLKRALQGLLVLYLPPFLLALWAGISLVAAALGKLFQRPHTRAAFWLRPLMALGAIAPWLYLFWLRPWHLHWGATEEELRKPLPGDELVANPIIQATHAVTINAPVKQVWPWLAQIGQDRAGFYSHEWLENLGGAEIHNADDIHPEWQQRIVGEYVYTTPEFGLPLTHFEPNRASVIKGWGAFVLEAVDAQHTRLIARDRVARNWKALLGALWIEIPHFIMQRGMLLGIKERAEAMAVRKTT
jgi:hypothetical protein